MNDAYRKLTEQSAKIAVIGEALAMLGWDSSAMMPPGGAASRADQIATLSGMAHQMATAPAIETWLAEAEAAPPADPWEAANLALLRRAHTRATALPTDLVEAQARANAACEKIWRGARAEDDFALVRPALEEVVNLVRQQAQALGGALGLSPYDALLDLYQGGVSSAELDPVFADHAAFIAEALPLAEEMQARRPAPRRPVGPFPAATQEELCKRLSAGLGLDFAHARLDRSTHPFCGGTAQDVRITTRYDEQDFTQSLMGVLHETGHALYERGLPPAHARQPVGEAAGMAVHESQSLLMEMQACRSDAYLTWLAPLLAQTFGGEEAVYNPANLGRIWRHVERGFIRVDADEMTYPAHVILRYRLEQALLSGDLKVADLPGAWAEQMQELLGITPPDDRQGCLQDIHWYDGAFGYFPCYTLGAMAAAQLMQAAREAVPNLDAALARGDFTPLRGWLTTNIHSQGSRHGFSALMTEATGRPLDPKAFQAHLRERYLK